MRRVNKTSAIEFVNKNNLVHWAECSAKSNKNIKETFKNFYLRIYLSQKAKLEEKTKNMKKLIIENSLKINEKKVIHKNYGDKNLKFSVSPVLNNLLT